MNEPNNSRIRLYIVWIFEAPEGPIWLDFPRQRHATSSRRSA